MATVHVYPEGDLIEHDTGTDAADCPCGPTTEFFQGEHASGWAITHHSLDGREIGKPTTSMPFPED